MDGLCFASGLSWEAAGPAHHVHPCSTGWDRAFPALTLQFFLRLRAALVRASWSGKMPLGHAGESWVLHCAAPVPHVASLPLPFRPDKSARIGLVGLGSGWVHWSWSHASVNDLRCSYCFLGVLMI